MKKMQSGGVTTYKGKKGATTKKNYGLGLGPDVTHKGKKGKTTSTLSGRSVEHKGSKGTTEKLNLDDTKYKSIVHKGKKGTTAIYGDRGDVTTTYRSNKTGKQFVKKSNKPEAFYKKGGTTKK
jgi:hypothetical protein